MLVKGKLQKQQQSSMMCFWIEKWIKTLAKHSLLLWCNICLFSPSYTWRSWSDWKHTCLVFPYLSHLVDRFCAEILMLLCIAIGIILWVGVTGWSSFCYLGFLCFIGSPNWCSTSQQMCVWRKSWVLLRHCCILIGQIAVFWLDRYSAPKSIYRHWVCSTRRRYVRVLVGSTS